MDGLEHRQKGEEGGLSFLTCEERQREPILNVLTVSSIQQIMDGSADSVALLITEITIHTQSGTRIPQYQPGFIKWRSLCCLERQQRCKFRSISQPVNYESKSKCIC